MSKALEVEVTIPSEIYGINDGGREGKRYSNPLPD